MSLRHGRKGAVYGTPKRVERVELDAPNPNPNPRTGEPEPALVRPSRKSLYMSG